MIGVRLGIILSSPIRTEPKISIIISVINTKAMIYDRTDECTAPAKVWISKGTIPVVVTSS